MVAESLMFVARNQSGEIYGKWTVRQWDGQEELPDDHPDLTPQPTPADQFKAIERTIDAHIDKVAADRGYGRVGIQPSASCIGYASYPNPWQSEAIKFGQWVASCQEASIQAQNDILAGKRAIPTPEEAVLELPVMVW